MDWAALNWVDWLFLAVVLYGAAMGAVRGLSHELATLVGMAVAVVVTRVLYEPLSARLCVAWGWNEGVTRLVAVVGLVLVSLYGMRLLRFSLGKLMEFHFKGFVERVGGLLTGMLRQGALFLVLLLAASFVPLSAWQRSVMYESAVGRATLPHMVEGYNVLAERVRMLQAEVPVGVQLPQSVMPPLVEPTVAEEAAGEEDYTVPPLVEEE